MRPTLLQYIQWVDHAEYGPLADLLVEVVLTNGQNTQRDLLRLPNFHDNWVLERPALRDPLKRPPKRLRATPSVH